MRNVFGDSCTKEGMGPGEDILEGAFKFKDSKARKKFDTTASSVQREQDWSESRLTQKYQ